jgi:hypothetical protein
MEVNAGVCGGHIGARALASKVLRQGFYWPAMIDNAAKIVSTYEACQRFSRKIKGPGVASAVNSSIVASVKMGHRHCRKIDSSARQLYLHSNHSGIFHKMDGSKGAYKRELCHNQKNSSGRT